SLSLARPFRCSTVTPGKFATFWRSPVNRLKSVDLPEFGGPTIATVMALSPPDAGIGLGIGMLGLGRRLTEGPSPWQLLILSTLPNRIHTAKTAWPPCHAGAPLPTRPRE